jgi:hypothetical protein
MTERLFCDLRPALDVGARTDTGPQRSLPTGASSTDAVRRWPAKRRHLIEDVAREDSLTPLPSWTAGPEALSNDRLVPEEDVLDPALSVVPRLLLPPPPFDLFHSLDRAISTARPRSPSRHGGRPRRRNDDLRATPSRGLVDADRVVGLWTISSTPEYIHTRGRTDPRPSGADT